MGWQILLLWDDDGLVYTYVDISVVVTYNNNHKNYRPANGSVSFE
jgi:hypothetical protein